MIPPFKYCRAPRCACTKGCNAWRSFSYRVLTRSKIVGSPPIELIGKPGNEKKHVGPHLSGPLNSKITFFCLSGGDSEALPGKAILDPWDPHHRVSIIVAKIIKNASAAQICANKTSSWTYVFSTAITRVPRYHSIPASGELTIIIFVAFKGPRLSVP